ncbi:MAG: peptidoglycan DD-metalloendopeptidase family protein [Acidobacteria bacterium]|nr:peptidoglycan DD-metalloendopeptidase family protein [Acidobacteriota bacterium]
MLLSLFGVVAFTTRAVDVARNTDQLLDLERLRSELRHSRQENQHLRKTLQRVGDRLSSLELLAEEVQAIGRLGAGRGRNGSPSRIYFSRLTLSEAGGAPLAARSEAFSSQFQDVDRQIDDLAQLYHQRYFRLSYTPSTWPADGILGDRFGFILNRFGPGLSRFHRGIDIVNRPGSQVVASADGIVLSAKWRSNYGKTIILKHHFGLSTIYAHLSDYNVVAGESVRRGQVIGFVGNTGRSTGPHLHYEVRIGDMPVNPLRYLSNQARVTLPKLQGVSIAIAR